MNEQDKVLNYLIKHKRLNSKDAYSIFGISRLSKVIWRIKKHCGETRQIKNVRDIAVDDKGKKHLINCYELIY